MPARSPRLPGLGRNSPRSGRHRRQLDALARDIRRDGRTVFVDTLIDAARGHADTIDRLEADGERSEHTVTLALSAYRQALADLRPYATDTDTGADPIAAAFAAALQHSAST